MASHFIRMKSNHRCLFCKRMRPPFNVSYFTELTLLCIYFVYLQGKNKMYNHNWRLENNELKIFDR